MLARPAALLVLLALAGAAGPAQAPTAAARSSRADAPPARSPRNANYAITVRLDPASRTIRGEEILTWRNPASIPATSLRFHLYYNAWRNTRSTWMRERRLGRSDPSLLGRPESDWGWIDVTSIRLIGGAPPADVTSRLRFIAPDDGNADDRTVMEVPLDRRRGAGRDRSTCRSPGRRGCPAPSRAPAPSATSTSSPSGSRRSACSRTPAGTATSSTPPTEFFSDFGTYDVRLTVPSGWIVGATGVERDTRDEADGSTTHHYVPGRRPRLRLDDQPGLRRARGALRASRPSRRSRCGCCSSPNTPARPSGISPRRARR